MTHEEMLEVQAGDTVCDCRYKHLVVRETINEEFPTRLLPRFFWWLPIKAYDFLYDRWPTEITDKTLVLEDGSHCSAISCADVVPHPYFTHEDGIEGDPTLFTDVV